MTKKKKKVTAKDVVREARKLIKAGWIQGRAAEADAVGNMSYCMTGAMNHAVHTLNASNNAYYDAIYAVEQAVRYGKKYYGTIISFNDADGRTKRQVLAKFDKALKELK